MAQEKAFIGLIEWSLAKAASSSSLSSTQELGPAVSTLLNRLMEPELQLAQLVRCVKRYSSSSSRVADLPPGTSSGKHTTVTAHT